MNIGRAIKLGRKAKNLTQSDLAKRAKLSVSYICLLENGKRDPNISILEKLSKALQISVPILIFIGTEENDLPELSKKLTTKFKKLTLELIHYAK